MSTNAKIVVPLLLAAAGAAWFLLQPPTVAVPSTTETTPQEPKVERPIEAAPVIQTPPPPTNVAPEPDRREQTLGNSHADAPQGVRGRVLRPDGAPAAGVPVYLMENVAQDIAQIFLNNKMGRVPQPVASVQTAADGTFALGVRKLGKGVDLRIVPTEHPEWSRQGIKLTEADWYDAGDVVLEAGLVVTGRVVDAATKTPIGGATVFLNPASLSHMMAAAPGRERGTSATTDGTGFFRFTNAPRTGAVNLAAEAVGYAAGQLQNQMLRAEGANDFTLEIDQGMPLAGVVVDATGAPIAGASLTANGLSAKTPQTGSASADAEGRFRFPSLRVGPYQLVATSNAHAETRLPLVMSGDEEVKVVMSTRGAVKLRVLAANGQPVKAYRIALMRHFPQSPQSIGKVMEWSDRSITPGDYPRDLGGQFAMVKGLPTGEFRFQITEPNHAKTLSQPFAVVEGGEAAEVVAQLTVGGAITGVVLDDRGTPVAGATVTSDMNGGLAAGTGIFEMFRSMMPEKHSAASTRTDAQGRFKLAKLAFADYMIRASHPDYCEGSAIDLKLESEGQVVDAGTITLALGAIVEGMATIAGEPAGQVKITLSTPLNTETLPPPNPDGTRPAGKPLFNATVQTENNGTFKLLKRVPPGKYKATAQRPTAGGDPFGALLDIRESEREVVVAPGQDVVQLTFALNGR